jgi:hypothetical protein
MYISVFRSTAFGWFHSDQSLKVEQICQRTWTFAFCSLQPTCFLDTCSFLWFRMTPSVFECSTSLKLYQNWLLYVLKLLIFTELVKLRSYKRSRHRNLHFIVLERCGIEGNFVSISKCDLGTLSGTISLPSRNCILWQYQWKLFMDSQRSVTSCWRFHKPLWESSCFRFLASIILGPFKPGSLENHVRLTWREGSPTVA